VAGERRRNSQTLNGRRLFELEAFYAAKQRGGQWELRKSTNAIPILRWRNLSTTRKIALR
jgi:hypothetical protein